MNLNLIICLNLDTLDGEILKIQDHAVSLFKKRTNTPLQPTGVQQAVKALIAFLGNIEPLDITMTLNNFVSSCNEISNVIQVFDTKKIYILYFYSLKLLLCTVMYRMYLNIFGFNRICMVRALK